MEKVMTGNYAAAHGARLCRPQVIAAYPITPQTTIIEKLADFCAEGKLDAKFLRVESEHSAMAACIAASAAGARVFTATSGQGLALMHEMLHWAAGARQPVVMVNVNRALAAPWTLQTDQNDSLSQRDTGWLQFYCESAQEVLDTVVQAYKVAEEVSLPAMVCADGFYLSHTAERVVVPEQEDVDRYLPICRTAPLLDVDRPCSLGGFSEPGDYFAFRRDIQEAMDASIEVAIRADEDYGERFGRSYGVVEGYRLDGAEIALLVSGTMAGTARVAVESLRQDGVAAGVLRIRLFRPFPKAQIKYWLSRVRMLAVVDRNIGFGQGGIFCQEVRAALQGVGDWRVRGFVAGLGGADVSPEILRGVVQETLSDSRSDRDVTWAGV